MNKIFLLIGIFLMVTLYGQDNTFPSTGNVGIGTSTPIAKLEVIGGPGSRQTFINVLERNKKSVVLNIGSIINSSENWRMFKLFDFPESNIDIKPVFYFALEDRNDMGRFRVIGETDGYTNLILLNKRQEAVYKVYDNGSDKITMTLPKPDSYLGIGTDNPQTKLDVVGNSSFSGNMKVTAKLEAKEIKVTTTPTADFVFATDYDLPKLEEVEKHIKEKKHLPEIASAKEMEKEGVNVGDFQIKLLQKIEELTLYTIEQNKQIKQQQDQLKLQKEEINQLKSQNKEIAELKQMVQALQTKNNQ